MVLSAPGMQCTAKRIEPSPVLLALALAVCHSKPTELSIKDYITLLRRHVQQGVETNQGTITRKSIDLVLYWKGLYEKAQARHDELKARVLELGHRTEGSAAHANKPNLSRSPSSTGIKSKRSTNSEIDKQRPQKKKKADRETPVQEPWDEMLAVTKATATIVERKGRDLAYGLYCIQDLYKNPDCDLSLIAHHLVQSSLSLIVIIENACETAGMYSLTSPNQASTIMLSPPDSHRHLEDVLRASLRSFSLMLHGLSAVNGDGGAQIDRVKGAVTHAYIKLLRAVLHCIATTALTQARAEVDATRKMGKSQTKRYTDTQPVAPTELTILNGLNQYLVNCLSMLDSTKVTHRNIFEGFMCVFIERLGKRLHMFVFTRERSSIIEEEILSQSAVARAKKEPVTDLNERAAQIEAPYLISLLEKVMSIAPKHISPAVQRSKSVSKSATDSIKQHLARKSVGTSLTLLAKERLQRTLVNAIFGANDKDEFIECLRIPESPISLPLPPKVNEKDMPQWFTAELWKLLGWDILARESEWLK